MLSYLRTVLISACTEIILMIPVSLFFCHLWRAPLAKCVLPHYECTEKFCNFLEGSRGLGRLFQSSSTLCCPLWFALSAFLLSFVYNVHLLPAPRIFCVTSVVRRLHPGQLWNHPVTRIPRLLPTQPELHVDNRDVPRQRLAEKFRVNTYGDQIQFPLLCHLPHTEWPFYVAELAARL